MRVILIEEERFAEIRDLMQAKCQQLARTPDSNIGVGFTPGQIWETAVLAAQRSIDFQFLRWAQSHGATCKH